MNTTWSATTRYLVGVGLVLLGIYLLYLSRPVIPLLIIAALISVILRPIILWLHLRVRLPRGLAVALVYLVLLILAPLVLLLAIPPIIDALEYVFSLDYQGILQGVMDWLRSTLVSIQEAQFPIAAFDDYVDGTVSALLVELDQVTLATVEPPPLSDILNSLSSVLTTTFGFAAGIVGAVFSQGALLIFMFLASIYISLGAHTYRGALLRAVPPAYQPEIAILLARIERLWNAFFRGQLTLMLLIGALSWLGLSILGVPGALYLGIVAGLLEIIPNLGPVIATIPAVIVALLQGSSNFQVTPLFLALLVILFYVLLQQLENNIIVPRVLGEAVELPPLVVMTGVLVGASVGGILGALLATPVVATGRELLVYAYKKMQGQDPFIFGDAALEATLKPVPRSSSNLIQTLRARLLRMLPSRPPASEPPVSGPPPASNSEPEELDIPQKQ